MFCPNCGKEIADTAKVCGYCGTRQVPQPIEETPPEPIQEMAPEPLEKLSEEPEVVVQDEVPAAEERPIEISEPELEKHPPKTKVEKVSSPAAKKAGPRIFIWAIIGLLVIAGGYYLLGVRFPARQSTLPKFDEPTPDLMAEVEPSAPSEPDNEPQAEQPAQSADEALSGVFVNLDLVEEIQFPNPDAGVQFNVRREGGIEVSAEANGSYGWYELAHGIQPGEAVFVKYRTTPATVYGLNMRNISEFQALGFRAWGIFQDTDYRDILLYNEEDIWGTDADWPMHSNNSWHEVFFANLGDGWVLIREENPEGFYNYYENLGEEYTDTDMLLEVDVIDGNVAVEQVIIFTFDDIDL